MGLYGNFSNNNTVIIIITINYRVTTVTTVFVLGTADKCLDILPFVDWACSHMVTGHQICTKKNNELSIINVLVNTCDSGYTLE